MSILAQPDNLSLSRNLKSIVVKSDVSQAFRLEHDGTVILNQLYEPDGDSLIEIDLREVIHARLETSILPMDEIRQTGLCGDFTAVVGDGTDSCTFRVVRGGVERLKMSAAEFLRQNFLTWQPTLKEVTYYSPEWLTYYPVQESVMKLRAYNTEGASIKTLTLREFTVGNPYTVRVSYHRVSALLDGLLPGWYDVWVEDLSGGRLTYVQRYVLSESLGREEDWFVFGNSLGGIDSFRAYGDLELSHTYSHHLAERDDRYLEYRVDAGRTYTKRTGRLTAHESQWMTDFFISEQKYLYTYDDLRAVVVTESEASGAYRKHPVGYRFTYKFTETQSLLNLSRTEQPSVMVEVKLPPPGDFLLPTRLDLYEDDLLAIRRPGSQAWEATTLKALAAYILALSPGTGGGEDEEEDTETHTISLGVNPSDVGYVQEITATGDVTKTTVSDDGTTYVFKVKIGGTATVHITPKSGYAVMRLNVDTVGQGDVSEYTFSNVDADHTMYLWMQTVQQSNPKQWLERSDLPGTYYDSLQAAYDAVVADYPDGLTRDVAVTCIQDDVTYTRERSGVWIVSMSRWNQGTAHTLTFDGAGQLTLDCWSLGGFFVDHVDNVVIRDIRFTNVANYIKQGTPEEMGGIYVLGDVDSRPRNLYVDNCTFDGSVTVNGTTTKGRYGIIVKYGDNVFVQGIHMSEFNCMALKVQDSQCFSLVKSYVKSDQSYGIIGHPALCAATNCMVMTVEDCEFTGGVNEYAFCLTNVDYCRFKRNHFHDICGEVINAASKAGMKEFTLHSNLFARCLSLPGVAWAYHIILLNTNVDVADLNANTFYLNSSTWQQWLLKAQNYHIETFNLHHNIVCDKTSSSIPMRNITLGTVGQMVSGRNLYQLQLRNETTAKEGLISFTGLTGGSNIESLQSQGYETGSWLLPNTGTDVLDSTYALQETLSGTYTADDSLLPETDLSYKSKSVSGNNVGCYNWAGTAIDETGDTATGYTGEDLTDSEAFSSAAQYVAFSDNLLLLRHNTLDRRRFVKMLAVGKQSSSLVVGRYGILEPVAILDANGEYQEDEIYDVEVSYE